MAQLLLLGTNFVNFVGLNAWTGLEGGIEAVRVTEWNEPQAVFGSYLQKYAYPDYYKAHVERNHRELIDWRRGDLFGKGDTNAEDIFNVKHSTDGAVRCLQLRGEYLYTADGPGGFRVYRRRPASPTRIFRKRSSPRPSRRWASTCMWRRRTPPAWRCPPTSRSRPPRNTPEMRKYNQEQAFHPIYHYAFITDAEEGLILVDIDTLTDREPRNNYLKPRADLESRTACSMAPATSPWPAITPISPPRAGWWCSIWTIRSSPRWRRRWRCPTCGPRRCSSAICSSPMRAGLEVLDVTNMDQPKLIEGARLPLDDARRVYVARTYAYVAAGKDGLVIADVKNPEKPKLYWKKPFEDADSQDVIVGSTNASLFAYVADGKNGLKVLQLTSPESQPNFYGFSPPPKPEVIAWAKTPTPGAGPVQGARPRPRRG